MRTIELYTVEEGAAPCVDGERITYIRKQQLVNTHPNRFFDSQLDEVLVNLCAARVLIVLEKEKEAAIARQQAEELLKQLTI